MCLHIKRDRTRALATRLRGRTNLGVVTLNVKCALSANVYRLSKTVTTDLVKNSDNVLSS